MDTANFTPVSALVGGMLIGISATLLLWLTGRVAGISGIVFGFPRAAPGDRAWRFAFFLGLLLVGYGFSVWWQPETRLMAETPWLLAAGALVGFGTRLGGGCTSGHGVCGLARLSKRSITATAVFMAAGILTVTLMRLLGVRG